MAHQEELEIEISPSGEVQVQVKGIPGPACLEYVEVFRTLLGEVTEQQPTSEYYEAETRASAAQEVRWR